jgi:hypothetical protein
MAMNHSDPFAKLRYYPAFIVLFVASWFALTVLFTRVVVVGFIDQVLLPRVHRVDLRPGDWVEVGSSGGYRPVLVRHADGSVTDTGELPHHLQIARLLPALLVWGVVYMLGLYGVARLWPKKAAGESGDAPDPSAAGASEGGR